MLYASGYKPSGSTGGWNLSVQEAQQEEEADKEQGGRTYSDVDGVVNATAKLIGEPGAPEYCQGKNFRIFLKAKEKDAASLEYKELVKVHLARQVGSRYYITSYNAGRILCLSEAIKEFLAQEQQLKSLTNLKRKCNKRWNRLTYWHSSSLMSFCLTAYTLT